MYNVHVVLKQQGALDLKEEMMAERRGEEARNRGEELRAVK